MVKTSSKISNLWWNVPSFNIYNSGHTQKNINSILWIKSQVIPVCWQWLFKYNFEYQPNLLPNVIDFWIFFGNLCLIPQEVEKHEQNLNISFFFEVSGKNFWLQYWYRNWTLVSVLTPKAGFGHTYTNPKFCNNSFSTYCALRKVVMGHVTSSGRNQARKSGENHYSFSIPLWFALR